MILTTKLGILLLLQISHLKNVTHIFPLKEDGKVLKNVNNITADTYLIPIHYFMYYIHNVV